MKSTEKTPRKHKREWADRTRTKRSAERMAALNEKAGKAGYFHNGHPSWSAFATAVLNDEAVIPQKER